MPVVACLSCPFTDFCGDSVDQNIAKWGHCLEYAALSDLGLRRSNNQDSMVTVLASSQALWMKRGHLFMVADGMGAHAAGELASKLATDIVPLSYNKMINLSPPEALLMAIDDANSQVFSRGQANDDFRGMGTTVSTLVFTPEGAIIGHVGDSRVYRLRQHQLEQLTFDHSLLWEFREAARISKSELPENIPKNIITRSLGPGKSVRVDLEGPFQLQVGDTFLLCSDGLSGLVSDDELGTIISCVPPKEAVQTLVDLANLRGGPDNITVIVAQITGPELAHGESSGKESREVEGRCKTAVHWSVWFLIMLFGLATLGLLAVGQTVLGLLGLVATLAIGVMAIVRRYFKAEIVEQFAQGPLGKGPYTSRDCTPDGSTSAHLADIVEQLRIAADAGAWTVDWQKFDESGTEAQRATERHDYTAAVKEHCHSIRSVMEQVRRQNRPKSAPNDAGLDLC